MFTEVNKKTIFRHLNFIRIIFVLFALVLPAPLYAWLNPTVDSNQDITGSEIGGDCSGSLKDGLTAQVCQKVVLNPESESEFSLDRCDTSEDVYNPPTPNTCHRWNLIWQYGGSEVTKSWPSIMAADNRLATYKEIAKLVLNIKLDDSTIELRNSIIGAWFESTGSDVWFISASYAKGTGTCGNHIYGVNASTGETGRFKLIDVEVDDGAGGTTTETQWRQLLSTQLEPTSCDYSTDEPNIHALTVNKSTVKELM